MNNVLIGIIVLIVGVGIIAYFLQDATPTTSSTVSDRTTFESTPDTEDTATSTASSTDTTIGVSGSADATTGDVASFTITGKNFAFSQNEIKVQKGQTVRITFESESGFHDFVIDEFPGARTKQLKTGEKETIEFVADKVGSFEYYCSVGEHRAMGMKGTLVVE